MQGMVEELYNFYTVMIQKGFSAYNSIVCSGNAVKKNTFLCEIIKEKFNLPLKLTTYNEEASYGAAVGKMRYKS
jgi:hypothetical protein